MAGHLAPGANGQVADVIVCRFGAGLAESIFIRMGSPEA